MYVDDTAICVSVRNKAEVSTIIQDDICPEWTSGYVQKD